MSYYPVLPPNERRKFLVETGIGANRKRRYFLREDSAKKALKAQDAVLWLPCGSGWKLG